MDRTTAQAKPRDYVSVTEQDARCEKVFRAAQGLFARRPDWVVFFRKILGPGGLVRREFPSEREFYQFEKTKTYTEIQQLLTRLRESQSGSPNEQEPTRVITVRLPQTLHEALRIEAYQHCTSMNKLCISKLLQCIEGDLVPNERFRLSKTGGTTGPEGPAERQGKKRE